MSATDTATGILAAAAPDTYASPAPDPEITTPDNDAPDSPATSDSAADTSQSSETDGADKGTPSKVPSTAEIRASLKAFREANPDHSQAAKLLNDGYSRYEAYKSVFPTVEDARTIKTHLDSVGGLEGIAEMQSTLTAIEETDALLDAGDPKVLDQILEDAPEGFAKLAPHYLEKLAKANPEAFLRAIQPHFVKSLVDANFNNVLEYLSSQVADKPEAKQVVDSMRQWFEEQKGLAERNKVDSLNPEREKISKEWDSINKEKRTELERGITSAVDPHIRSELGGRLRAYSAALNALPLAVQQDVARACIVGLGAALRADKPYQSQIKALMEARKPDRDKIIALNKNKVTEKADTIIANVVKSYGLKPGAAPKKNAAPANTSKTPTSTKIVKLSAPPKDSDIDWNHANMSQMAYIKHRAVLKDGRFVSW
jgi:hypothetical protein